MAFLFYFLCLLPILLVSLIFLKNLKPSKWNLPPGPKTLPIIGNIHNLKGLTAHACYRNLSQKHGPVMLLRFGLVPVVVISSKEAAEEVLKTQDLECCSRPETVATRLFSYNFKDIGFAPYGKEWKTSKKLAVMELFSMKKIQSFKDIREEETALFVKKLTESARAGSPVNLTDTLFTLVASMVFRVAYGQKLHDCKLVDGNSMAGLIKKFDLLTDTPSFADLYPGGIGWLLDRISGQTKRLNNLYSELDIFYQNILDDHLKPGRRVPEIPDIVDVMIDMMRKQEKDGESFKLTTDHLKAIISEIFLAGVTTTVITLVWAMTELIRNPRVMKKVQDEIRTTIGDNKERRITEDDLTKLHYFKLVVKETFRLHPPNPLLLPRETLSDIKIQGYDIPAKTQMMINIYTIARDPKLWENPNEFNPERFLESSMDYRGLNFEFLPFGSGRRACPGRTMAVPTVELGLLNLLYFFDWGLPQGKTVNDIDLEETGAITLYKKSTLELVPLLHH